MILLDPDLKDFITHRLLAVGFSIEELKRWIEQFSQGKHLPFPFSLNNGAHFTTKVLKSIQNIPFGTTASYGEIAQAAGHPGASRAVGTVCRKNQFPILIPCHRVVCSNGTPGNYAFGADLKESLLNFEKKVVKSLSPQ